MTKRLVVISGNIATGKTTLTKQLASALDWRPELESVADNPYLADFYRDMPSWSFHLQFHFLGHRVDQHQRAWMSPRSAILDRSIYEDADVFAAVLHETGQMTDRDFATYRRLFDVTTSQMKPPDLILYLHAPTKVLLERIRKRGRPFEQNITDEYLSTLDRFYKRWINSMKLCPILKSRQRTAILPISFSSTRLFNE